MAALSGIETIKQVAKMQRKTLLAFSGGKDAVAAYLAIREHFDEVIPYYLYLVPGLEFVDAQLDMYERQFGFKITQLPHPSVIEGAGLPDFDYTDIQAAMVGKFGLPKDTLVADGVRAADSPMRRIAIQSHGSISYNLLKYHPIWDWKKADLVACFKKHNVRLGSDYKVFGRSFDGLDLRFLLPIKKHYPRDYQRILELIPMADLEIFRWECANGKH